MKSKAELEHDIKIWEGINPIIVKQAKNQLSEIDIQKNRITKEEKVFNEDELMAFDVYDADVNRDGKVDEQDIIAVSKKIAINASKPKKKKYI